MWFKELTGFDELSPDDVRNNLHIEGKNIISKVNGKSYHFGVLEIPTLSQLRLTSKDINTSCKSLSIAELVGNAQTLHCNEDNKNALFQAASQFNLLEMVGPHITPEKGVGIYENDYTQGPACAIACGAGTIYRNYFAAVQGNIEQTAFTQIDCLCEIGKLLNNEKLNLWKMANGYALLNQEGLLNINKQIAQLSYSERETLKGALKIGLQWNTEVTLGSNKQLVSQAYCSALPVAYSNLESYYFESFARVILEATYEATFHAALINLENTGSKKLFLTLVGGGAFGNEMHWIIESLQQTIALFKNYPLQVNIVSYGNSNEHVVKMINEIKVA